MKPGKQGGPGSLGSRKPEWLRTRPAGGQDYHQVKRLLREAGLHTVCESAACPNRGECFTNRTATFLLLGPVCTRACTFCNIEGGPVTPVDPDEPRRVAEVVGRLALRFAVVTSVTRDDLPDGGASHFAATIRQIRRRSPGCAVEVLIPDFRGSQRALQTVLVAGPDVLNHNLETVPRLYHDVRPQADYRQSLLLLRGAAQWRRAGCSGARVKTGIMVGLGESREEVLALVRDVASCGVDTLTIGQYLQPSVRHHPVVRYYRPQELAELEQRAHDLGIPQVVAGPLVRSSYKARELADATARHTAARTPADVPSPAGASLPGAASPRTANPPDSDRAAGGRA